MEHRSFRVGFGRYSDPKALPMLRSPWLLSCVCLAAVFSSGVAIAQPTTTTTIRQHVDARVWQAFRNRTITGRSSPFYARSLAFEQSGALPLLVHFVRPLTQDENKQLLKSGVRLGTPLTSGAFPIVAREKDLHTLLNTGLVRHISVNLPPPVVARPLDQARSKIGITGGLPSYQKKLGFMPSGKGLIIGDMDSSVDPFHPALFHSGTHLPWVDVNNDKQLTPGVDGVDLNNNGTIEPQEILRLYNGFAKSLFDKEAVIYGTNDSSLNPGFDYLYLDTNGDGTRNAGDQQVPNAETMPGLGEPIFAADDVDHNGIISLYERIVMLEKPKIKGIYRSSKIYEYGTNLSNFKPNEITEGDSEHGTCVLGIMAGGQPGISRFLGLAPEADLLVATTWDKDNTVSLPVKAQWLHDKGADVAITELGTWGYEPSDGSGELEQEIDALVDGGMIFVSPSGNLGGSGKHAFATVPTSTSGAFYNSGIEIDNVTKTPNYVWISVTWMEGTSAITGSLSMLDNNEISLEKDLDGFTTSTNRKVWNVHGTTPKGAGYLLMLIDATANPLPHSGTKFKLQSQSDKELHASLFIMDENGSWSTGSHLLNPSDEGSMANPSAADNTIAVGAFAHHVGSEWIPYPEKVGELRGFSGRGPTLWGDNGISITAPDNSVSSWSDEYAVGSNAAKGHVVHWSEFGGTSGAGPHVAGMMALLKQANPTFSSKQLRELMEKSAVKDDIVNAGTAQQWGHGKLHIDQPNAPGTPAQVDLIAPTSSTPETKVQIATNITDTITNSNLKIRWDLDYDGTWDTPFETEFNKTITMPDFPTPIAVKVEVVDDDGWSSYATIRVVNSFTPEAGGSAGSGSPVGGSPGNPAGSAGASGNGGGQAAPGPTPPADDGCGCRTAPARDSENLWIFSTLFVSLCLRRWGYWKRNQNQQFLRLS
jgi:hypothetical protein